MADAAVAALGKAWKGAPGRRCCPARPQNFTNDFANVFRFRGRGPVREGGAGAGYATLELSAGEEQVSYAGQRQDRSGATFPVAGSVTVDWQPANFGGERAVFICRCCGRPARRLFLVWAEFHCTHCAGVRYASKGSRLDPHQRRLDEIATIRARLNRPGEWDDPVPEKPKGMHQRIYDGLWMTLRELIRQEQIWVNEAVRRGELGFRSEFARVFRREVEARRGADETAA